MEQAPSTSSRIMNGLISGLKTGLLMMGIFALLSASAYSFGIIAPAAGAALPSFTAALMNVLPGAGLGLVATALFGAVNGAISAPGASHASHAAGDRMVSGRISQAPAIAMPILAGHAPAKEHTQEHVAAPEQASWASRVGQGHQNRIAEILANGSMSDKDRAAAIMAERSQPGAEQGRA